MSDSSHAHHESCSHSHHSHGHHHHHGVSGRMGVAFFLNLGFAIIELIGGIMTNSMAILSDALHDFGDAFSLGIAWWLEKKSHQQSDETFSYGYRRFSIFSATITGVLLVTGSVIIVYNSILRLQNPEPASARGMMALAILGLVVNAAAFYRLSKGQSLNEKMLSWHFIEDMTGWAVVLVGSLVMMAADVPWLDPLMAICLSVWVLYNVLRHLRETVQVFMQITPAHLRGSDVSDFLKSFAEVSATHHTHVWTLDGESHIMTTHVVLKSAINWDQAQDLKNQMKHQLRHKFGIHEATIEFEIQGQKCDDEAHRNS